MNNTGFTAAKGKEGLGNELAELLRSNVRDYVMYIALVVIFIFFGVITQGTFLSPRNLSDLVNQSGYVAVIAIGMTVILIIKHIDLSVGFVAGFLGAVAAILMKNGVPIWAAIPIVLVCGIVIGLYQGTLVAIVGVPAFVVTLAGMFIFRGLLSLTTAGTGAVMINDEAYKAICQGFIPDLPVEAGIHILTLIIGGVTVLLVINNEAKSRKNLRKYNFDVNSLPIAFIKVLFLSVIIMYIIWTLASYKGIPWAAVIVVFVLIIYNFILNKTRLGRYIYGIGGNAEAAELSGVNVRRVTLLAFCSVSMLAALGGILYSSRLASASPQAGVGFELDAIASAYIGGVSVNGGIGRVTNTIVGTLVIMSLTNGMNLMGIDVSYQYVVKGVIFILAVAFDIKTRNNNK